MRTLIPFLTDVVLYPVFALVISMFATWLCIRILPVFGYVDIPHGRHLHKKPVPCGGGIAIVIAFFSGFLLYLASKSGSASSYSDCLTFLKGFLPPAVIIFCLGLADDRMDLKSTTKLLFQILAGALIWYQGNGINEIMGYALPVWISLGLTVFWTVGVINAYNLIDGLDGIAAGLAVVSSLCMALWLGLFQKSTDIMVLLLIFAASCLGFLRYNFHPARIFMGDTGSTFIGLMFAFVSMHTVTRMISFPSMLLPVLAIGIPLFDESLAIWRRFVRRKLRGLDEEEGLNSGAEIKIMSADTDHLHHRLFRSRGTQPKTAFTMYFLAFLWFAWAAAMVLLDSFLPGLVYLLFLCGIFLTVRRLAGIELYDSFTLTVRRLRIPRKRAVFIILHPVFDIFIIFCSYLLTYFCLRRGTGHFESPYLVALPLFLLPYILLMVLNSLYRIFWIRVGINTLAHLIKVLFLSFFSGYVLFCFVWCFSGELLPSCFSVTQFASFYAVFTVIACVVIFLERFFLVYMERFGMYAFFVRSLLLRKAPMERCIVYGGGLSCRLYFSMLCARTGVQAISQIVGIMDDSSALKHLYLYGFRVLGSLDELDEIYKESPFDRIVITLDTLNPDRLQMIREFAKQKSVKISVFSFGEQDLENALSAGSLSVLTDREIKAKQKELAKEKKEISAREESSR